MNNGKPLLPTIAPFCLSASTKAGEFELQIGSASRFRRTITVW